MMTGTYLEDVAGGVIAPPEFGFSDWLGEVVDSFSEGSAADGGGTLSADQTMQSSTDGGSSPEGYSAQ